jgi:hypothetical protein
MPQPRPARLALGFLLAPLVPAFVWAFSPFWFSFDRVNVAGAASFLVWIAIVAYATAAVDGIPVYVLLRRRLRPRLATVAAAAGLIAIVPWLALYFASLPSPAAYARVGDCVTVVDGARTWCGYVEDLKLFAFVFILGALGGVTFWLCAVWRDERLKPR